MRRAGLDRKRQQGEQCRAGAVREWRVLAGHPFLIPLVTNENVSCPDGRVGPPTPAHTEFPDPLPDP